MSLWMGLLGGLAGCGDAQPEVACVPDGRALSSSGFVEVRQGGFWLDGAPFRFQGTNLYYALEASRRGELPRIEAVFDDMVARGMTVASVWAFNTDLGSDTSMYLAPGELDPEGLAALDRVVAAAASRGLRLILTLSNHWPDYGGLDAYASWAGAGDRAEALATPEVRGLLGDFAVALAARHNPLTGRRYRDEPAILGWDLMNEPRCPDPDCAPRLMADFLALVGARLRAADPNHLIGTGDEGWLGEEGVDIDLQARVGGFDWVSVHLYPHHQEALAELGGGRAWVEGRAAARGRDRIRLGAEVARRHGRPLLVGELGWPASAGSEAERAAVLGAWLDEADAQGAGGVLVWMLTDPTRPDYDGYAMPIDRRGPTRALLCGWAERARR